MRLVSALLSLLMVSVATVVVASNINVTSHAATTQGSRYYNEVLSFDIDTFTPETSEGDVEVRFEFDATDLTGLDVVVFEDFYRIDTVTNRVPSENDDDIDDEVTTRQRLVASHADINDEGQTRPSASVRTGLRAIKSPVTLSRLEVWLAAASSALR